MPILIDERDLVSTIAESFACQLRAKAQCELPPKVLLDIARNAAQAVLGLELADTHVIEPTTTSQLLARFGRGGE
jgi:hypothetical protein